MTAGGPRQATHFFMLHLYNNAFQWFENGIRLSFGLGSLCLYPHRHRLRHPVLFHVGFLRRRN